MMMPLIRLYRSWCVGFASTTVDQRSVTVSLPPLRAPVDACERHCTACEVGWRGADDDPCWCCGRPGVVGEL